MKKIIFLLAFLFATITNAQTPARHYGGVILGSFASDPTGVSAGQIYWNTTDNTFRAYDGSIWSNLVGGGVSLQDVMDVGNTTDGDLVFTDLGNINFEKSNGVPKERLIDIESSFDGTSGRLKIKRWNFNAFATDVMTIDTQGVTITDDFKVKEKTSTFNYLNTSAVINLDRIGAATSPDQISTRYVADSYIKYLGTNSSGDLTFGTSIDIDNNVEIALTSDIPDYSDWLDYSGDTTTGNLSLKFGDFDAQNNGWYMELGQNQRYFGVGDIDDLNNSTIFAVNDSLETYTFGGNNNAGAVFDVSAITNVNLTFPSSSGQLALTSEISDVSDFMKQVNAGTGEIYWFGAYPGNTVNANNNGTYILIDDSAVQDIALVADGGVRISSTTASATLKNNLLTLSRDFEFPNASGTLALTSDIPTSTDYVDLTSAQTISGDKTFSGTNDVTGAFRIFVDDNSDLSANGAISQIMKKDTDASGTQVMTYDRITYDGTPSGSTQGKYNYYQYQGQSKSTNAWHNVNYYRVEDDEDNNTSVLPNSSLQNYNLMYQRSSGTGQNISGEFGNNINRQYWDSGYGGGYMDEAYNVFNILSYDNSDWTTGEWWSSTNKVEATAGTITNLKGVSQTINLSGTVNNSNLYGFYFDYTNTSSGTQPTNAFAFYNDSSLPILSDGDIEITNNRKLLIQDTGGDFTDYDTSFAVAPVWESGHSDAVKIGKYNKLLVEQNASTQYWNYNDVRLNGNTNGTRYDMNWTGSYYNGIGGFSEGTTHSLNQMLIKNTTSGTRDFGFVYNQNNIINVDDFDGGTVTTTVEDFMPLFNQSNINDDNITINDHWLNLNQLNYQKGSIGELYGLNVDFNISGSAEVTTSNHLINLEYTNSSSGSVATPYAIYSSSDIPSYHRGDIEIGNASDILLDDNGSGSGASRVEWNSTNYIEYDDQTEATLYLKGGDGIVLDGDVSTFGNSIYVGSGSVYTGSSGGSATIRNDDLKLVRGTSGNPQVTGTAGVITHAISFDANGGSNTTLSTPNGYVGQIAVAHEKTPQIEIGSSGGTTNSIDGKDFYYLKWTGGNGNETFNLPDATTNQYRTLQFITNSTVGANKTWTLDGSGSQTIDGSTTYVINRAYEGIKLWSDGTEWIIIQAKK